MQIEKIGDRFNIKTEVIEELDLNQIERKLRILLFDKERLTKELSRIDSEITELSKHVTLEEPRVLKNKTI